MAQPTENNPIPPRPMVLTALAFAAGLIAGLHWPLPGPAAPLLMAAALAGAGWRLWRSRYIRGPRMGSGALLLVALAVGGWWQGGRLTASDRAVAREMARWSDGERARVEGVVAEEPRMGSESVEILLDQPRIVSQQAGGGAAAPRTRIALRLRDAAFRAQAGSPKSLPLPGQRVRAWGRIRPVAASRNPNPFDAEGYWRGRGVGAQMTVTRPAELEPGPRPRGIGAALRQSTRSLREALDAGLAARLAGEHLKLAHALLLGDARRLDPDLSDAFQATGLAHLLAVSGMNTAYILLLLIGLGRILGMGPRGCAWLGMIGLTGYTALTGFQPPVVRAATMGIFVMAGLALARTTTTLAAVATAAFVTLLADPRNILRVDWQLSYVCVLGIILLAPPMYEAVAAVGASAPGPDPIDFGGGPRRRLVNQFVILPIVVSLAAQLAILPIQIHYFHYFNWTTLLTNAVAVPLSMLATMGAMATGIAGLVPGLGWVAALPCKMSVWALIDLVRKWDDLGLGFVQRHPQPLLLLVLYYGLLLGGDWLRWGRAPDFRIDRRQKRALAFSLGGVLLIAAAAPVLDRRPAGLDLYMLDVGQGDALVARFPNGAILAVDGGSDKPVDQGEFTIAPFLRCLNARAIDCVVATHADADHIGGLPYLIEHCAVERVLAGPDTAESGVYRALQAAVERRGTRMVRAVAGERLEGFGPGEVRLLGPIVGMDDNNASVVLLLTFGAARILLTGDLEAAGERRLLRSGAAGDVDVLKVGHHGSRSGTSEEFVNATRPEIALVSVGARNRYRHPADEVIERLESHGSKVVRTDQLGAVWIHTDGQRIWAYRYAGP